MHNEIDGNIFPVSCHCSSNEMHSVFYEWNKCILFFAGLLDEMTFTLVILMISLPFVEGLCLNDTTNA